MKTKVEESKIEPIDYPKLMKSKSSGDVLLMQSPSSGMILSLGFNHGYNGTKRDRENFVGESSRVWQSKDLEDFHGSVTIEQ